MSIHKDYSRPIARRADPITSHEAADYMKQSGKLADQLHKVFDIVKANPHCTAFELERYTDLDRYQIQRRLSDLAFMQPPKVIASKTRRKCFKSGRMARTWKAI